MKQSSLFILCVVFVFAGIASAQSKTVTNDDLAKYREKRLQAEKDLRENYVKLGFPSPEELEKQRAKDAKEREDLSARLMRERLERERRETEQRWLAYQAAQAAQAAQTQIVIEQGGGYYTGFSNFRNRNRHRRGGFVIGGNPIGWRAAGGQIIYEPGGRSSNIWSPTIQQQPRAQWLRP